MIKKYHVYTPQEDLIGKFSIGVIIKNKKTKTSWPEVWVNSKQYVSRQFGRSKGRICFETGRFKDCAPEVIASNESAALEVINERLSDKAYLKGLCLGFKSNEYEFFVIKWTSIQFPNESDAKKYLDARFPYKPYVPPKEKTSKKKPQLIMQAVDRTEYDPKTGKVKSLPDGPKIPIKFSKPKKPLKNLFEKMLGIKLDGNQHRIFLSILDDTINHKQINDDLLRGTYGIVIRLLEEKKLLSCEFSPHFPEIMPKGLVALKFLKGFCDDKCCHGC